MSGPYGVRLRRPDACGPCVTHRPDRTNPAIAEQLVLSVKTVRNYVSSIFRKLQVADRAQAIIRARAADLGQEPT